MHLADECENLPTAQVVIEDRIVGQITDAAFHLDPIGLAIKSVDRDATAARHQDAHHDPDRRCLAGAVGAEEAEDLPLLDGELEIAHGRELAVSLAEMVKPDPRPVPT